MILSKPVEADCETFSKLLKCGSIKFEGHFHRRKSADELGSFAIEVNLQMITKQRDTFNAAIPREALIISFRLDSVQAEADTLLIRFKNALKG